MLKKDTMHAIQKFVQERDWGQFHNPKDLAIALSIESSELLELFLWKEKHERPPHEALEDEVADVFICALLLAEKLELPLDEIILKKLKKNAEKYPVEKSKGKANKYTEL